MEKMTYVAALNYAIENLDNAEVVEKLTALRDATIKRNTKSNKVTPKEQAKLDADAIIRERVRGVLSCSTEPLTMTTIKDTQAGLKDINIQKLSAVIRKMVLNGEVVRTEVKHKAMFTLA